MSFLLKLLERGTISIPTTSDSRSKKEDEVLKNITSDSKHGICESWCEVNELNYTLISKAQLINTRAEHYLNPQMATEGETSSFTRDLERRKNKPLLINNFCCLAAELNFDFCH